MRFCLSVTRDLRRSGSSPVKAEGERSPVGPPKSRLDVKPEEHHGTDDKYKLFGESSSSVNDIIN